MGWTARRVGADAVPERVTPKSGARGTGAKGRTGANGRGWLKIVLDATTRHVDGRLHWHGPSHDVCSLVEELTCLPLLTHVRPRSRSTSRSGVPPSAGARPLGGLFLPSVAASPPLLCSSLGPSISAFTGHPAHTYHSIGRPGAARIAHPHGRGHMVFDRGAGVPGHDAMPCQPGAEGDRAVLRCTGRVSLPGVDRCQFNKRGRFAGSVPGPTGARGRNRAPNSCAVCIVSFTVSLGR